MTGNGTTVGPSLTLSLLDRHAQVPERSGLNWWNAGGRQRNVDEVYVRLPTNSAEKAREVFGDVIAGTRFHAYFSLTDEWMILRLEGTVDQETRQAKQITSDGDKKLLGNWLLRVCLQVPVRHVVTVEDLNAYGSTAVTFTRIGTDPVTGWARVRVQF